MQFRIYVALSAALAFFTAATAAAEWPLGVWVSEGERGQIQIYPCNAQGHDVSDPKLMAQLCAYTKGDGKRLCGKIVKVLANGEAELRAKGMTVQDQLRKPMLCIVPSGSTTWPWKGGVFNPNNGNSYYLRAAPDPKGNFQGSGCADGLGFLCESFVWKKANRQ